MHSRGFITPETRTRIHLLQHIGSLIANTGMRGGNLSFLPDMTTSPAWDILPMMYAPQSGIELIKRLYFPSLPLPDERPLWIPAANAAQIFWQRASEDPRISATFRQICEENAKILDKAIRTQY